MIRSAVCETVSVEALHIVAVSGAERDVQSARGYWPADHPEDGRPTGSPERHGLQIWVVLLLVPRFVEPNQAERAERGVVERQAGGNVGRGDGEVIETGGHAAMMPGWQDGSL